MTRRRTSVPPHTPRPCGTVSPTHYNRARNRALSHVWSLLMRRVALVLATTAAALILAAAPALAGSAHYVGTPTFTTSGATITVTAKEAGLGDEPQIHVVLSGTATCVNGGGNHPKAANKTTFTAAADEPVQNGHSDYTLTATAVFAPSAPCPGPMLVAFTDVTLTDTTNGLVAVPVAG